VLFRSGTTIGAGLGHIGVLITLQNRSSASCQLTGYPGLQLLAPGGRRLPTSVTQEEDYLFPAITPHRVAPDELDGAGRIVVANPIAPDWFYVSVD
jgi:hypothetical protein